MRCRYSGSIALWSLLACAAAWLLMPGCGGGAGNSRLSVWSNPEGLALPNPADRQTPDGVDPALWRVLTDELKRQIELQPKSAATTPWTALSRPRLKTDQISVEWGYYSQGDYDQNSEVNAADLVPLAKHFHESALPNQFPPDSIQAVVDGDNNGEINLADVTPIAVNFHNTVNDYRLYRSLNAWDYPNNDPGRGNGDAELIATIPYALAQGDSVKQRIGFNSFLPEVRDGEYLWVRPADEDGEGIASYVAGPLHPPGYSLSGYVLTEWGAPVEGVDMVVSGDGSGVSTTTGTGYWQLDNLLNGVYSVTPEKHNWRFEDESAEISIAGEDAGVPEFTGIQQVVSRTWGAERNEVIRNLAVDAEGNAYALSEDRHPSPPKEYEAVLLVKYNPHYELEWVRSWNYGLNEEVGGLCLDRQGNPYVLSSTEIPLGEVVRRVAVLLKFNPAGELIWQRQWGHPLYENCEYGTNHDNLGVTPDNNIVFLSSFRAPGEFDEDCLVALQVTTGGFVRWKWEYRADDQPYSFQPLGIDISPEGRIAVIATSTSVSSFTQEQTLTLALEDSGAVLWSKKQDNTGMYDYESQQGVAWADADHLCISSNFSDPSMIPELRLRKLNSMGEFVWAKAWSSPGFNHPYAVDLAVSEAGAILLPQTPELKWSASGETGDGRLWSPEGWFQTIGIVSSDILVYGGYNLNADGDFSPISGVVEDREIELVDYPLQKSTASGAWAPATGTVEIPSGVENTGGGGSDMHLVWVRE